MTRKFTHYLLLSVMWLSVLGCQEDEVSAPPTPALTADKSAAQVGETVTFTINEVKADAVSLLPYGLPGGDGGVLLDFTDGVATVEFEYSRPGTFDAIVVANNHTIDGESIVNVKSSPFSITITTSADTLSAFRFITLNDTEDEIEVLQVSSATVIDNDNQTIDVTVPYGTDVTQLMASFTAAGFSTVTANGVEQKNEESVNDFSSPVVYTVTAQDGTERDYTVTVNVTPVETLTTFKSITATAVSTNSKEKVLSASIDNVNRIIVIYDTLGTPSSQFDSIRVGYELDGKFAKVKYNDKALLQDSRLDFTSMNEFEVYSQDSLNAGGIQTYEVYAVDAPKLTLSFPDLNPDPAAAVEPTDFHFDINALKGTDLSSVKTTTNVETPTGVSIVSMTVNGVPFTSGNTVSYSGHTEFELLVNDTNIGVIYTVLYTVTVTPVP